MKKRAKSGRNRTDLLLTISEDKKTSHGASIDVSVRSVLHESRPGFPARGHDSEFKRDRPEWVAQ